MRYFTVFDTKIRFICNNAKLFQRTRDLIKLDVRLKPRTFSTSQPSKQIWKGSAFVVGAAGLCGCGALAITNIPSVHCKAPIIRSRLDHLSDKTESKDAKFDWKKLFSLLVPELGYLIAAILSALAAAFINIRIPVILGDLVNVISSSSRDEMRNILDEIKKPAVRLIQYYCLQGILTFSYISLLTTVGENVANNLRKQLFEAYLQQDIEFFDKNKTGELIDRLTSDVQDFKSSFKLCISSGLRAVAQTIGCVGTMYSVSPKLTGLMITVVPAIIGTGTVMGSGLRKMSKEAQNQLSKSTAVADEAIGNIRTVRAFAMEPKEKELFKQEVDKSSRLNVWLGVGIGAFQGLSNIALNGIVLGTIFLGGRLVTRDEISPGNLMSFLVCTQTIERSLAQLSLLFGNVVRGMSAGARVFEYINNEPSIPLTGGKKIPFYTLRGDIEFNNVRFSYPTRSEQEVLKDFSLKIPAGKVVALVGLSGGGKSTVASLLERFYEVKNGEICIDGTDIKNLDPSWLRGRAIGFINQEPVLFATSVMENIRYGRPDASDGEVLEAAELANAHGFIQGFPEGYNTVLGERGVTVSGGQKQRIAIARALIKNPSILVLDEATSALDAESERIVQEALNRVIQGRTVLIVAHRLSTIRDADVIAVISDGKVVEQGNHDQLKKKKGLYWELIKQQEIEDEIQEMRGHFF